MKFIKSYYPVINACLLWVYCGILIVGTLSNPLFADDFNDFSGSIALIPLLAITIMIFTLILKIVFIVDAAKRFKGADLAGWIALILFTESNYILCHYNFRFKQNRKDYKTLIIFYIISVIASFIFGGILYKLGM